MMCGEVAMPPSEPGGVGLGAGQNDLGYGHLDER